MNLNEIEIRNLVGGNAFIRGKNYLLDYIRYIESTEIGSITYHEFEVESESSYDYYDVTISERDKKYTYGACSCRAYESTGTCKHIAAVLLNFNELTSDTTPEEKSLRISKEILKEFYTKPKSNEIKLKKQLTLEACLEFYGGYHQTVGLRFKIGETKLYSMTNKLSAFLKAYENKNEEIYFGKDFTYDPSKHYFSKTDEEILDSLLEIKNNNFYYSNGNNMLIPIEKISILISKLKNKKFMINNNIKINNISTENPFNINLTKDNDIYKLEIKTKDVIFLERSFTYVIKDDTLYILPQKISRIIELMHNSRLNEITFKEEDLELFSEGILPLVKNNVKIDSSLEDKIMLGVKPEIEIYLDFLEDLITCEIKLIYNSETINYFEKNTKIIRDKETEDELINDLLSYGFEVENQKIYISDIDLIGDFIELNLTELAKKYEVFTSDKIKKTNILKENNIRSSFSIGEDNILKYEFDLGEIKPSEIVNILENLKTNKKYYRLKNGDIINLSEREDLKELDALVEDMELSNKDIKNGQGIIPKYRAIYLDSVKNDKYHIIKTNNLFDDLINKFNSYKETKIQFTKKEKETLRDYQQIGVKWLYNIYKCGFGGILADEMGLGKSIQLINFIKQILKEKKDALILIVAPTSLVYNWKNEFDKFGSEIKYKVLAENRTKRKEDLENLNNINVLITTYGLVRQDKEEYMNINFELIAIDEAQNIKNPTAGMTKVIKSLKANTKIALTGTPLENSVLELWSIFDFIMPGYLANLVSFNKKYSIKDINEEDLKSLSSLNKQISPFILRRKKKDVVKELPDKIENNIYIELTKEQKKLYLVELEKTKKEMDEIIAREGFKKGNFKILQLLTRLRQLCIDPKIIYDEYEGESSKIEHLIELTKDIIKNGHKILLFTSYKTALDIVNREFTNNGISTFVIDGSVSSKKRMELVDKFNIDDTNVFLITLKSGGTGLNLTSADVVIHLDLWWNPQVENQATDRAHRIGQKNTVEVIKLICKGTIEERILELQEKKKILSDKLIEGKDRDQNIISKLTEKDIKNLLSMDNDE